MTKKILYLPVIGRITQDDISESNGGSYCLGDGMGDKVSCDGLLCRDCLLDGEAIREDPNRLNNVTVKIWRTSSGQ